MIRTSGHRPRRGGRFVDVDEGEWAEPNVRAAVCKYLCPTAR